MIPDYTTVVGVDERHLRQLSWTWPTWKKHKPSILERKMVVFYDCDQLNADDVRRVVDHPDLTIVEWPEWPGTTYSGDDSDKFSNPQRHKMLAGFLHVPYDKVKTPYWLKIDTDTVATGSNDWIDPDWFIEQPAIISHPWGFTKPPNQMLQLDAWAATMRAAGRMDKEEEPLNLAPKPESSRLSHKRIISWVGFFNASFTQDIADIAEASANRLGNDPSQMQSQIPVPSQDGYFWYMATLWKRGVVRANMKERGWKHQSSDRGVMQAAQEAMNE